MRRLEETMERYQKQLSKSTPYVVNRTLQNVAGWAAHYTRQADRPSVIAELELTYRLTAKHDPKKVLKKPQLDKSEEALRGTVAAARHAARLRLKYPGRSLPPAAVFYKGVAKMIGKTLASIAFMKSGWLPAYRALKRGQAAVDQSSAFGARKREGYGGVVKADETANGASGEIYNQSINRLNATSWQALEKYGGEALNRAVVHVQADMEKYLTEEHDKAARESRLAA